MTNQPSDPIDEPSADRRAEAGRDPASEGEAGGTAAGGGVSMNLGAHAPPLPARKQRGGRGVTTPPLPGATAPEGRAEESSAADELPADAPESAAAEAGAGATSATGPQVAPAAPDGPGAADADAEPETPVEPPRSRVVLLAVLAVVIAFAGYHFLGSESEDGRSGASEDDAVAAQADAGTAPAEEPVPIDPTKLAAGREDMFLNSIDSLAQPAVSSLAPAGGNASAAKGKAPRGVQVAAPAPAAVVEGDLAAASPEFVAWAKSVKIGGVRLGAAPRVVIGSAIVAPGAKVDAASGAVFVGIDEAKRLLRFREPSGAELGVRY